ncbi:relaxase/mobilization nuclease domain-containing protein (plasmid) [Agrobacterium sp. rho-8.1]|nr:relaxase/mobilization nuclease domain-containing protein [Agrobacterium sp. rho-8.1]
MGAGAYYLGAAKAASVGEANGGIRSYMLGGSATDLNLSNGRVGFTETRNLSTDDPGEGFAMMQATYERYQEMKRGTRGQPLKSPVYSFSLSWAIEERPDQATMVDAAEKTLELLGMSDHQAIFVSHIDKPYDHIHVIVNRIKPDFSGVVSKSMDRFKLSAWAEDYERRHGKIHCEQRVRNNALRRSGFAVKDLVSKSRQEIEAERRSAWPVLNGLYKAEQELIRDVSVLGDDALGQAHVAELEAVFAEVNAEADASCDRVLDAYRPGFAQSYSHEKKCATDVKTRSSHPFERAAFVIANRDWLIGEDGQTDREIVLMSASSDVLSERIRMAARQERISIGRKQKQDLEDVVKRIWSDHHPRIKSVLERQARERAQADAGRDVGTDDETESETGQLTQRHMVADIWSRCDSRGSFEAALYEVGLRLRPGSYAWLVTTASGDFVDSLQRLLSRSAKEIDHRIGSRTQSQDDVSRQSLDVEQLMPGHLEHLNRQRKHGNVERGRARYREERRVLRSICEKHGVKYQQVRTGWDISGGDGFRRRFPRRLCRDLPAFDWHLGKRLKDHSEKVQAAEAAKRLRRSVLENLEKARLELDNLTPAQAFALATFELAMIDYRDTIGHLRDLVERKRERNAASNGWEADEPAFSDRIKSLLNEALEFLPERKLEKAFERCKQAARAVKIAIIDVFEAFRPLAQASLDAVSAFRSYWKRNWQDVSTGQVRETALGLNVFARVADRLVSVVSKVAGDVFSVSTDNAGDLHFSMTVEDWPGDLRPPSVEGDVPSAYGDGQQELAELNQDTVKADDQQVRVKKLQRYRNQIENPNWIDSPDAFDRFIYSVKDLRRQLEMEGFPVSSIIDEAMMAELANRRGDNSARFEVRRSADAEYAGKKRAVAEEKVTSMGRKLLSEWRALEPAAALARIQAFEDQVANYSDEHPQLRENLPADLLNGLESMRTTAQRDSAERRWLPVIEDALSELGRAVLGNSDREIVVVADKYYSACASARSEGVLIPSAVFQQFVPRVEEAKLRLRKSVIGQGPSMGF